jgi:hypothetical protein
MIQFLHEGERISAVRGGQEIGHVLVKDMGEFVSALDLTLGDGTPSGVGALLAAEVAKIAGNRDIYLRVSPTNEKAIRFYIAAGMEISDLVMVRRKH